MKLALKLVAAFVFSPGFAQAQEIKQQWCQGQHESSCTVKPHYACPQDGGPGAGDVAKSICTLQTANGPRVLDHRFVVKSSTSGNRCGYTVFEVTCYK